MVEYYNEFDGIVLSIRKHREKDALVKIFTREHGKRMFFVKNIKNPNHALKAALLPFTKATYLGRIKEDGLCFLQDSRDIEHFSKMQTDIHLNAYATYLNNLADAAINDGIVSHELYDLLYSCLEAIQNGMDAEVVVNIFEMRVLKFFGADPQLQACAVCHSQEEPFDFSVKFSGVLCQKHFGEDNRRQHANPAAIHFARIFLHVSPKQIASVQVKPETKKALREFIDFLYEEYVGIRLKSKSFIDDMFEWEQQFQIPVRKPEQPEEGEKS
ncbi:recombination protein o reco [Trichococcus palustris]|jgi:DNA repair protein RecO (recombination protein O)|uniref:DNA repair protein RecO n=1 Tax=Trichococcus palustris TaxID=140314 RepID=A0A143YBV5_9LACT|nr:DNA repair protein RecO [Trichococcus palustris]CZQ86993.1 recombination protein o reco [Trichococcus palustris]SFK80136.1 DNA replication and repair protein RecO [Trichococcus palustris]